MMRSFVALAFLALALVACTSSPTAVRLEVAYEDTWGIETLEVSALEQHVRTDAIHELLLLVDDDEAPLTIEVTGLVAELPYAYGSVEVTPVIGGEVRARVVLELPSCESACDEIPEPDCSGPSTLRTYTGAGTCLGSRCEYPFTTMECDGACDAGECGCTPGWTTSAIDPDGSWLSSIAVDGARGVHVALLSSNGFQYAHRPAGGTWSSSTIAAGGSGSIAVDSANGAHVIHRGVGTESELFYGHRPAGGTFSTEMLTTGVNGGCIAVDEDDQVHIAYIDDEGLLYYRELPPGGDWTAPVMIGEAPGSYDCRLAIGPLGEPHVGFPTFSELLIARRVDGTWETLPVGAIGELDFTVGTDGTIHAVVVSGVDRSVHYRYRPPAGPWSDSVIDADSLSDAEAAIAVDASGVHIALVAAGRGLRYFHRAPNGELTHMGLDDGEYSTDIAVDADGRVHISFYDWIDTSTRYARLQVCP